MSQTHSKASIDNWIKRIQEREMPIFGKTVQSIVSVSKNDKASISQLAKVVLQDSSMTTKVLKLANTTFYRPIYNRINTVTRAVMVLGFETIGNISISVALVDSLLTGKAKDRVTQELARAIHAAVQARSLAVQLEDPDPEEVFVATLLYNIGDMAFWCFAKNEGEQLSSLMRLPGYSPEQAQRELLGFPLKALSLGMVKQWGINQLLVDTLEHPAATGNRGQVIQISRQLAHMSEAHGWDSQEVRSLLEQASKLTRTKPEVLIKQLHENAKQAAEAAACFGSAAAAVAIPMPNKEKPVTEVATIEVSEYPEPDPMLQLRILRELSQSLDKQTSLNFILEMVMEGIYRGVGFDRALFALSSPDRKALFAKFALGKGSETLSRDFRFSLVLDPDNIFFQILEKKQDLWVDTQASPSHRRFVTPGVTGVLGNKPFFCGAIRVGDKSIGIIYADRAISGRNLDDNSFESFRHFVDQACMILSQKLGKSK